MVTFRWPDFSLAVVVHHRCIMWGGKLKRANSLLISNKKLWKWSFGCFIISNMEPLSLHPFFRKGRGGSDDQNYLHSPPSFRPPSPAFLWHQSIVVPLCKKKGKCGNKWVVLRTNEMHLDSDGKHKRGGWLAVYIKRRFLFVHEYCCSVKTSSRLVTHSQNICSTIVRSTHSYLHTV